MVHLHGVGSDEAGASSQGRRQVKVRDGRGGIGPWASKERCMKIGVTLPNHWGVENVHDVLGLGPLAESLGYASVWTMDHLLNIGRVRERIEDRPYWHPLSVLSHLAATTERVQLGTSVLVLPYHDPVGLAKYAATLDHLSNGRLLLGVGVGALAAEFDALGVPVRRRGALTDESIAVMHDLWTNREPGFHGGRFAFADLRFSPRCLQQPHVPLLIGGSSAAAIARTARVGNGWHPANVEPGAYAQGCARVRELAAAAGRDPSLIEMSLRLDVDTAVDPFADVLAALADRLTTYRAAGCQHALLALTSGDVPRLREWMQGIAQQVLPVFAQGQAGPVR
jgi:probable F420-dependent oxidoreductase